MYVISFNNINICILLKHTTVAAQLKKNSWVVHLLSLNQHILYYI